MIAFENVSYHYENREGSHQLNNINLNIPKGKFLLITGKSGCGKTTLAQCINGLIPYFHEGEMTGNVWIEEENTRNLAIDQIGEKVGSVFQNPRTQFFTTSTMDEIAFGCQNMSLPREEILRRIEEAFHCFHLENLRERSLFELSSGEKQKVAIASCYSMKPDIFLLDEPSANLDPKAIQELAATLKLMKDSGYTIIIMEHRLYYLKDLIDEVIYMREGNIIKHYTKQQALALSIEELEEMGLRAFDLGKVRKKQEQDEVSKARKNRLTFEVKNLSFDYPKKRQRRGRGLLKSHAYHEADAIKEIGLLKGINIKMYDGEIIGIVGKNGAGKTTLAKLLSGLIKPKEGSISLNGHVLDEKERIKKSYFVFQDSDYQLFTDSVETELVLGNEKQDNLEENCEVLLKNLGLEAYKESHPAALSRGQKQRVTIASSLLSDAPILFFDEPTSGLDGESMQKVTQLLEGISQTGKILFVISHDYEFLARCCNRIIEIKEGTVSNDFILNNKSMKKLQACLFGKEVARC